MTYLKDLALLDLRSLSEALASHSPAVSELPAGQWLGVVELLTLRLTDECADLPAESWVTCSNALAYTLEAAMNSGSIDHHESVIRRLNIAVSLFMKIPPNAEVDILDPTHLVDLLFQELPMSADQALGLAENWRSLDITQIRSLRAAKNLLSPALRLASLVPNEALDQRLKSWREVFPALP
ncbi:hypothetical protein J7E97_34455 [Streptomyces sp. ISL-66]|uniref:hypothetical protein n=1 Tax=Streptomyces sp. ISL-66 TaxID=2819186 RepID=UPI001BEA8D7A|nr:hypothetical protein [Streptomyces sp. ISL-66]MBT2472817.1 hypothetical protein [Streptomyces sp. ISL-66]